MQSGNQGQSRYVLSKLDQRYEMFFAKFSVKFSFADVCAAAYCFSYLLTWRERAAQGG